MQATEGDAIERRRRVVRAPALATDSATCHLTLCHSRNGGCRADEHGHSSCIRVDPVRDYLAVSATQGKGPSAHRRHTPVRPRRVHIRLLRQVSQDYRFLSVSQTATGRSAVQRLMAIANACPSLAQPALARAVKVLHESREPQLYINAIGMHNSLPGVSSADQITADQKWIDDVQSQNASERNKLEVELKTYTSNMIKESIRVSSMLATMASILIIPLDGPPRPRRSLPPHCRPRQRSQALHKVSRILHNIPARS